MDIEQVHSEHGSTTTNYRRGRWVERDPTVQAEDKPDERSQRNNEQKLDGEEEGGADTL